MDILNDVVLEVAEVKGIANQILITNSLNHNSSCGGMSPWLEFVYSHRKLWINVDND